MSPANLELAITEQSSLIGQLCVIGDRRPYVVALVVLEPTLGEGRSPEECEAQVQRAIDAGNAHLARVEQVKRFAIVPGEWLPGGDELTPTSKLKRASIAEKYAAQMDALYS